MNAPFLSELRRLARTWFVSPEPELDEKTVAGLTQEDIRLIIAFLSELGVAMNGAGDATTFIRRSLHRTGRAYGLRRLSIFVVPTLMLIRYGDDRSTFIDLSSRIPKELRLDQIADLYQLVDDAENARITPADGLTRLRVILNSGPRHTVLWRVAAAGLIACGVVLHLDPSYEEVALTVLIAVAVGVVAEAPNRWPQVWPLVPAAAGLLAASAAFFLIDEGLDARPLRLLIPAVVTFLPGAALTVSLIELSNGDIVAGGSRLAYGIIRLFLLVFGVLVAEQWVGFPRLGPAPETIPYVEVAKFVGIILFTAGIAVYFSAPRGSFLWLLLVVLAAWAGQEAGNFLLGGELGGFVGGALVIFVAQLEQGHPGAPPLLVSFTPAFWFLVPGAIGLEGLTEIVQEQPQAGVDDLATMVATMISISLGVLFGLILSGSGRIREAD